METCHVIPSRNERLDVVKGIGIFFVVAGHIFTWGGVFSRMIFLFHMPLFFTMSGVLFARKGYPTFSMRKFVVPYAFFLLLSLFVGLILNLEGVVSALQTRGGGKYD